MLAVPGLDVLARRIGVRRGLLSTHDIVKEHTFELYGDVLEFGNQKGHRRSLQRGALPAPLPI